MIPTYSKLGSGYKDTCSSFKCVPYLKPARTAKNRRCFSLFAVFPFAYFRDRADKTRRSFHYKKGSNYETVSNRKH